MCSVIWSDIARANSSWTFSRVASDFISVAMMGRMPCRNSQTSLAISTTPTPPPTMDTMRPSTAPISRWPTRAAIFDICRRTKQDDGARQALAAFEENLAGGNLRGVARGIDLELPGGAAADDAGDGGAVAGSEEGLQAADRGLGRIHGRQLDALADVASDGGGDAFDRRLDGVGALIHALGRRGGELLGRLARGQQLEELPPARLVAQLLHGLVDAAVDDAVHIAAPPGLGDDRLVAHAGEAVLQRLKGQGLDGSAEAGLVARLAGFVLGTCGDLGPERLREKSLQQGKRR